MRKILFAFIILVLSLPVFAEPPEATTLVPLYGQAQGFNWWGQPWLKENIVADSAAIVDDTTIYSDPIFIAPFGGIGVLDFFVTAVDTDSVAVQYGYQLSNYTGNDLYWTTFETSDTLYLENTLENLYVDFDTCGAYSYLRVFLIPQANADTTFICDDNINAYCWFRAHLDANYYKFDFNPTLHTKRLFDDGYSIRSDNGKEY